MIMIRRAVAVAVVLCALVSLGACGSDDRGANADDSGAPSTTGPSGSAGAAPSGAGLDYEAPPPTVCPPATVTVSTAKELTDALADAEPGDSIALEDGTYAGNFTATGDGTADAPIFVCGSADAVIDSGGPKEGYGLHLEDASYWRLVGFTVQNAQKGVMFDAVTDSIIDGLTVSGTGDEAIHLRKFSANNIVMNCEVFDTGNRREKFGEGIYVGTAVSNWEKITGGEPDTSDNNVLYANNIHATTAENIDLKEGTTGGLVIENTLSGDGLTEEGADSWVDVKGRSWMILNNTGSTSPLDGYQTHEIEPGWGTDNVFDGNVATDIAQDDSEGVGFALKPELDNQLTCNNQVSGGELSNVACT